MRVKGHAVVEHSDGTIHGITVFTGKAALKEARAHFVDLVVDDMESQFDANDDGDPVDLDNAKRLLDDPLGFDDEDEFDENYAKQAAKKLAKRGNYTSDSEDCDIVIIKV